MKDHEHQQLRRLLILICLRLLQLTTLDDHEFPGTPKITHAYLHPNCETLTTVAFSFN